MTELLITERRAGPDAPPVTWVPDARPEPAPVPRTFTPDLDGAAVLDEARDFLARFYSPPSKAALDVMTLWGCHTWAVDKDGVLAFDDTPRIAFVSDEPKSGKSKALELLALLCRNAEWVADPTGPGMLKAINTRHAVLMVDENDLLFGSGAGARAVRTVLNTGFRKGVSVLRVQSGGDTFAPAGLAGLAASFMGNPSLEPTRTRCVIVHSERPPAGVKLEKYRLRLHAGLGTLLGQSLGAWVQSNLLDIIATWPEMPSHLDGREEDAWLPLFAIAQVAGGDWPERIWRACVEFTTGVSDDEAPLPPRARLLQDIAAVWPGSAEWMTSADLVEALSGIPGAPWGGMWEPVAMLQQIPAMLGISPARVDGLAVQGYQRSQMAALWASNEEER